MSQIEKIELLTKDQEIAMLRYRDEWLNIGRSCEPADRSAAGAVFKAIYAEMGKPEPKIWWCDGPAVGSMVRAVVTGKDKGLWANLGDNLRDNLWANLGDNLGDNLSWYFWGQHEAAWPAYYNWPHEYLRPMHEAKQITKLGWWLTLSQSCGWWEPYEGVVFACERPAKQAVDNRGRLHCDSGPAFICRDGWVVHAVHGVRVPADIIENPKSITAVRIKAEQNAEVRRVMMMRFGFERYISEIGAQKVHMDAFGTLYRIEDTAPFHIAHVMNSTPEPDGSIKPYYLGAPDVNELTGKRITTAHEAAAWTFGLHPKEYRPQVQT